MAIAAHTEEMERVQAALRQKTLDVARLERSVDDMTRDMQVQAKHACTATVTCVRAAAGMHGPRADGVATGAV